MVKLIIYVQLEQYISFVVMAKINCILKGLNSGDMYDVCIHYDCLLTLVLFHDSKSFKYDRIVSHKVQQKCANTMNASFQQFIFDDLITKKCQRKQTKTEKKINKLKYNRGSLLLYRRNSLEC